MRSCSIRAPPVGQDEEASAITALRATLGGFPLGDERLVLPPEVGIVLDRDQRRGFEVRSLLMSWRACKRMVYQRVMYV